MKGNKKALAIADENRFISNIQSRTETSNQDFNSILRHYQPLIGKCVSQYSAYYFWKHDIEQEAILGLHEAIRRFDFSKGTNFAPFAKLVIKNRLIDFYEKTIKVQELPEVESDYVIEETKNPKRKYSEERIFQGESYVIANFDFSEASLTRTFNELRFRTKDITIFNFYFRRDYTVDEISEELGFPRSTVHQIVTKTKNAMIEYYTINGYKYIYSL